MNVIPLLVFLSLTLVCLALLLFFYSVKQGDHEHADRLSLLPLEEDEMPHKNRADIEKNTGQDLGPLSATSTESEHEHDASPHDPADHL